MPIQRGSFEETQRLAYTLFQARGASDGFDQMDWFLAEQQLHFAKNYEVASFYPLVADKQICLGDKALKTCRFCRKSAPDVTFRQVAHALPEMIGNKSIISHYECDTCNGVFARNVEDHLGKLLSATSTLTMIRAKGGINSYKTRAGKSRIDVKNGIIEFQNYLSDNIVTLRPEDNAVVVTAETQPFVPMAVFKCFAKMALSVMPDADVPDYQHTIDWILNPDHTADAQHFKWLTCYNTFLPGPMQPGFGWSLLLRRKEDDALLPSMIYIVTTMNQSFQIMLPCSHKDNHLIGHKVEIPPYPSFAGLDYDFGVPVRKTLPLSSTDTLRITLTIETQSESMVKSP
jgi:hypothetical protein